MRVQFLWAHRFRIHFCDEQVREGIRHSPSILDAVGDVLEGHQHRDFFWRGSKVGEEQTITLGKGSEVFQCRHRLLNALLVTEVRQPMRSTGQHEPKAVAIKRIKVELVTIRHHPLFDVAIAHASALQPPDMGQERLPE